MHRRGIYPNIVPVHKKGDLQRAITDQFYFFLFLVGFLRKSYLIPLLDTFKRMDFVITNQVFKLLIYVGINNFLLFMTFMHLLIITPPAPPEM